MTTLTAEELHRLMDNRDDLTVINVLPEESFNEAHIPDTINVPLGDNFVERVKGRVPDRSAKVVVYCANESCDASTRAARTLESAGFQNVYDFEGGVEAWKQHDLSLQKSTRTD